MFISRDVTSKGVGRLVLIIVAGFLAVLACLYWTLDTFIGDPPPPSADVQWSNSTATVLRATDSQLRVQLTGSVENTNREWQLTGLKLMVAPENARGVNVGGPPHVLEIAPDGVAPGRTLLYSEEIWAPLTTEGFEEELVWVWQKP